MNGRDEREQGSQNLSKLPVRNNLEFNAIEVHSLLLCDGYFVSVSDKQDLKLERSKEDQEGS